MKRTALIAGIVLLAALIVVFATSRGANPPPAIDAAADSPEPRDTSSVELTESRREQAVAAGETEPATSQPTSSPSPLSKPAWREPTLVRVLLVDEADRPLRDRARDTEFADRVASIDVLATREPPAGKPLTRQTSLARWHAAGTLPGGANAGDGLLELLEQAPLYVAAVAGDHVLGYSVLAAEQSSVKIAVPWDELTNAAGSVRLEVVDAVTNAPIADAVVRWWGWPGQAQVSRTDPEGFATLTDLAPGVGTLLVQADEAHETLVRRLPVAARKSVELTLPLHAACSVSGRLLDAEGRAIGGNASAQRVDVDHWVGTSNGHAQPENGFRFDRLGPVRYRILAYSDAADGGSASVIVDLAQTRDLRVDLHLVPDGVLTFVSRVRSGTIAKVVVRDAAGDLCFVTSVEAAVAATRRSREIGNSWRLPRGRYSAEIWIGEELVATKAVAIGEQETRLEVP